MIYFYPGNDMETYMFSQYENKRGEKKRFLITKDGVEELEG